MQQVALFPAALSATRTITVGLVDDHELTRRGVRQVLNHDRRIRIVGEAADADSALEMLERLQPDVLLLDIRLGESNGIDVVKRAGSVAPHTRIVVLSAYDHVRYVTSLMKMGAVGYLLKSASASELKKAVFDAAEGRPVFTPEIADKVIGLLRGWREQRSSIAGAAEDLTARESEVLRHLGQGLRNSEIARSMGIALKTVEVHVQHVLKKLGVRSRTQAALKALETGLL